MEKSQKEFRLRSIKNLIRKHSAEHTLTICANLMSFMEKNPIQNWTGYTPWSVLFVAKTAILDHQMCNMTSEISQNQFNHIIKEIKQLDSDTSILFNEHPQRVHKFMREMAFQQFWFQYGLGRADIARQTILFQNPDFKYPIDSKFFELTGLTFEEYIQISFLLYASLETTNQNTFSVDFFRTVFGTITREKFIKYLDQHGGTISEARFLGS